MVSVAAAVSHHLGGRRDQARGADARVSGATDLGCFYWSVLGPDHDLQRQRPADLLCLLETVGDLLAHSEKKVFGVLLGSDRWYVVSFCWSVLKTNTILKDRKSKRQTKHVSGCAPDSLTHVDVDGDGLALLLRLYQLGVDPTTRVKDHPAGLLAEDGLELAAAKTEQICDNAAPKGVNDLRLGEQLSG